MNAVDSLKIKGNDVLFKLLNNSVLLANKFMYRLLVAKGLDPNLSPQDKLSKELNSITNNMVHEKNYDDNFNFTNLNLPDVYDDINISSTKTKKAPDIKSNSFKRVLK